MRSQMDEAYRLEQEIKALERELALSSSVCLR